jgi:DNA-binding FrmR family transcriptional regulator
VSHGVSESTYPRRTEPQENVMQMDDESAAAVTTRLRRARGQLDGVLAMIEAGRDCEDVVTQLSAASKAVDRAAFTIVSCGLKACIEAEAKGETPPMDRNRLEKLFLSLA